MSRARNFWREERGATAVEFALVLPVALLFLLGIIDVGRYAWAMNRYEKAVQMGTRYAVTTDVVPIGLREKSFESFDCGGASTLGPGDTICKDAIGTITCTGSPASCTCADSSLAASCENLPGDIDDAAFQRIVARMRVVSREVTPENVRVIYSGSGIGYAGDPGQDDAGYPLSEVSPVVTVRIVNPSFRPISLLGWDIGQGGFFPDFRYSQTLEDGVGQRAY